jgi:hypothetical protein
VERTGIDLTSSFRGLGRLRGPLRTAAAAVPGGAPASASASAPVAAASAPVTAATAAAPATVGTDEPAGDHTDDSAGGPDPAGSAPGATPVQGGRFRRWWATTDRSFLAWGVVSYLVVLGVVLALGLREAGGHLVYVLDDPAIHQSVATNLVDHGTWGVVPGHVESASSSPLWTVVLAAYLALPLPASAGPLLLNAAAAIAVIAILGGNQAVLRPARRRLADGAAVTLLVTVVLFLPGLTLVGMEHILHMATVLGAVVLFHRYELGELRRWPRWLPFLLLALATFVRLETVFVGLAVAVALLARAVPGWRPGGAAPVRRQLVRSALVGAAAAVPLVVVGVANRLGGQGWLPNSVLAKSRATDPTRSAFRLAIDRFTTDPLVGALTVMLLVALVLVWRRPWRFAFPAMVAIVTVVGHAAFARIGWYERYQAYLLVLIVYAGLQLMGELAALAREREPGPAGAAAAAGGGAAASVPGGGAVGRGIRRPTIGLLVVMALLPFCGTKLALTVDVPLGMADTYEQRYQAGRFLARYYDGEPVATGELGYVSVMHRGPITDLFGLGDYEVLEARLDDGRPSPSYWSGLAQRRGFEVAAVYPSTLGFDTPDEWILAGWWTLPRRTVSAFEPRFEFWATTPEALYRLQDNLRAFEAELPEGVEQTVNEPAELEAMSLEAKAGGPAQPTPTPAPAG